MYLFREKVKKALMTQQPSELLLKGVVSSEVRAMETDLERKVRQLYCCQHWRVPPHMQYDLAVLHTCMQLC